MVAAIDNTDVPSALRAFGLVGDGALAAAEDLEIGPGARSVQLPRPFSGTREDIDLLALGFGRGRPGALAIPYAKVGAG